MIKYITVNEEAILVEDDQLEAAAAIAAAGEDRARVWVAPQDSIEDAREAGFEGAYEISQIVAAADYREGVEMAAKATAKLFVEEFGEILNPAATDWDSVAWQEDRTNCIPASEVCEKLSEKYWPIYQAALVAETERLHAEG